MLKNLIVKPLFVFAYNHLTVSKRTNDVLKAILQNIIIILLCLILAIDWDKTLDNLGVLK